MNPYRMAPPPRRWEAKLSPRIVRLLRLFRRRHRARTQHLMQATVRDAEIVRRELEQGHGVLITPNHSSHADPHSMYEAADQVGRPFYFMSTWHVFDNCGPIGKKILQWHGVFSIDREGTDLQAFKKAVKVVQDEPYPLVIFPEGEVYHCNERVTPFREGAAVVALSAAKRAKRPVVAVPCAMRYEYLDNPTDQLLDVMQRLEQQIHWRPKVDLSLPERIYAFAQAAMSLKEMEFLGHACRGTLPERTNALACHILAGMEEKHQIDGDGATIPERVKELRRRAIDALEGVNETDAAYQPIHDELDDLFLVVQLFSYPGDYVAAKPSLERMAETLDKFEEDVLHVYSATIRGHRKVTVRFGQPIPVEGGRREKGAAAKLTENLESAIQEMLDEHGAGGRD